MLQLNAAVDFAARHALLRLSLDDLVSIGNNSKYSAYLDVCCPAQVRRVIAFL
jgi:hypothetical protein